MEWGFKEKYIYIYIYCVNKKKDLVLVSTKLITGRISTLIE